ncbi:MAG: NUDIX domain-containing protein [Candidatus Woesearchaeota archaeon]
MKDQQKIDMITEENESIGSVTRAEVRKHNLLHRAVLLCVFNSEGNMYIRKRSLGKDVYPDLYGVSCEGMVFEGETFEDAAERKLKEELGITAPFLFVRSFRYKDEKLNYLGHIYAIQYEGKVTLNSEGAHGSFVSIDNVQELVAEKKFMPDVKQILTTYIKEIKDRALK